MPWPRFINEPFLLTWSTLSYTVGHVFLATTVTNLGAPIIVLALYDGLVCALVRMKSGVISAAISQGMAICVLATGLI